MTTYRENELGIPPPSRMPDANMEALDRMADFALLPDHIKELGQRLQRENDALRAAAAQVDGAWDRWMMDEEGEGQDGMENAIADLRRVLRRT